MRELLMDNWERRDVYEFFSKMSQPFYTVTFRQDVSELYQYTKTHGLSFYEGMIWACTEAMNRVEAFRYTMRDGKPVLLERRGPSFTDLRPRTDQFFIVTMDHDPDIRKFCEKASELRRTQKEFINPEKETDDLIYLTCLPWIDLTAMTNERDLAGEGALDDSIPRLAWGKYTEENGRKVLGLSVEVNHRFIDGVHIGQFAQELTKVIKRLE